MAVLQGGVRVNYSQFYVLNAEDREQPLFEESFYGQVNAICGAQTHSGLFLITGLYMGMVPVEVQFFGSTPPLGAEWEEAVEASIELPSRELFVMGWAGESGHRVAVPRETSYRVRYCVTGMDAGRQTRTGLHVEDAPDRYLLQLWPGSIRGDEILRQTSDSARIAHSNIGRIAPP